MSQTVDCCKNILENSGMEVKDINGILLVGGTSRVPIVHKMVQRFAGSTPVYMDVDPDLAVAMGALEKGHGQGTAIPVMMADECYSDDSILGHRWHKREQISEITFQNHLKNKPDKDVWDVSERQDGTVMAWVRGQGKHLFIGGEGGVAPKTCNNLFRGYIKLKKINFNDCFDTSQVTDMSGMFYGCSALRELDVRGFDTYSVTDMHYMFSGCSALQELDVRGFDTSSVTNMSSMFSGCSALQELDVRGFDTSSVTDISYMFDGCTSLQELDVRDFETSSVTNMRSMFWECGALQKLDVRGFDMSNVIDKEYMTYGCNHVIYE